ncbi:lipoprotein [Allokutzneria sp. A3M-2-11 16]|uniref:lipoprotein n=1 Tax=Allokutzneria sp. A3M-2-11 16 TaxID=2962043 RepID=UPI0020B76741|nr:lipoprotein [Allokutzneria sp. A3M-2-11 16]MCP3802241.1 lipoprotein [Allokutzneria sp. A3M-2-11 16]
MRSNRLTGLVVLGATALLLAGCGQKLTPTARADDAEITAYNTARFDEAYAKLDEQFTKPRDQKSTISTLAAFGGKKALKEIDIVWYQGADKGKPEPPAIFTKSRTSKDRGDNYDVYHPSGSERDYALLGALFKDLAPTPWVSYPTFTPKKGFNVCLVAGIQTVCAMQDAIKLTQKNAQNVFKRYKELPDGGTQLETGVTLKSFIDGRVMFIPEDIRKQFPQSMLDSFIPTKIVAAPNGDFKSITMNGTLEKEGKKLEIAIAYDITGKSAAKDFPPPISDFDVTALGSEAARKEFLDKVAAK